MPCEITCKEIEIVRKIDGEWSSSTLPPELFRREKFESNSVVFIFAKADRIRECSACRTHFENKFQLPELWWFSWCRRANGFFGSEEKVDSEGKIEAHNTWFRFIIKRFLPGGVKEDDKDYVWYKFNVFTHWVAKTKATFVLVFNARPEVKEMIVGSLGKINQAIEPPATDKNATEMVISEKTQVLNGGSDSQGPQKKQKKKKSKLNGKPLEKPKAKLLPEDDVKKNGFKPTRLLDRITHRILINPYAIHVLFMEDVVYQQDESIWGIRDHLREFEIQRTSDPNYQKIHDIARHAIHVSETLDAAICTITSIKAEHDHFQKAQEPENKKTLNPDNRRIKIEDNEGARVRRGLDFADSMLRNLRFRSSSNMTRLQNEIQLSYNTVSQQIGRAAKADSNAMLGIALLTMIFLPPTFISGIFSMSFFDYDSDKNHWAISGKIWLYVATTIPITFLSISILGPFYLFTRPGQTGSLQEPAEKKKKQLAMLLEKWKNRHAGSTQSPV